MLIGVNGCYTSPVIPRSEATRESQIISNEQLVISNDAVCCHAERSRSISSLATHYQRGLSLVGFEEILRYTQNDIEREIATACSKPRNDGG